MGWGGGVGLGRGGVPMMFKCACIRLACDGKDDAGWGGATRRHLSTYSSCSQAILNGHLESHKRCRDESYKQRVGESFETYETFLWASISM